MEVTSPTRRSREPAATRQGRVLAVCLGPTSGIPKYPQPSAQVGPLGVEGDFHAGPYNRHKKTGPLEPHHRQVTVVAREALEAVGAALGIELKAGDLGENILVEGLGDLSDLQARDRLKLGHQAVLEVTGQNRPCTTLNVYHPDIVQAITGRRGVTAVVVTTGTVRPGDGVELLPSA